MKRTISLIILLAVATVLVAQPVSQSNKGKPEKASKMYVVLGKNIRDGKHTKEKILSDPAIYIKKAGAKKDVKWSIVSFRVCFVYKGMEEPPILCQGNTMNERVKKRIEDSAPGLIIYFADVKVSSEEGTRMLDEFFIRVK